MGFKSGITATMGAAVLTAFVLPFAVMAAPAAAAGGPALCVATGTVTAAPGLSTTAHNSAASFGGTSTCVGGGGSGGIHGSGTISGTCVSSTASFNVGGALSGHVSVTTVLGVVVVSGTLNGSSVAAVGLFVPTVGNCVTAPVTKATFVLAGPLI